MNKLSFGIKSSKDFLNKLIADFDGYLESGNSSRIALNCAMTSWHLTEWIYHEFDFKNQYSNEYKFQQHIKGLCSSLQIMHDLSNGTKHFKLKTHKPEVKETERKVGAFDNTFDFSFERTMLKIVMPKNKILVFDNELKKTIDFWTDYLNKLEN